MIDYINSDLYNQEGVYKQLVIAYDEGEITNSDLHIESFELEESLCSEQNLKFGCCESAKVSFKIRNPFDSLKEKEIVIKNILNRDTENPLQFGKYKVASDVPSSDRSYRIITAYDKMYEIQNADVTEWYENIFSAQIEGAEPQITLKEFRKSFISHFGLEEEEIDLVNDSMLVMKTISGTGITGKMVISAICEINGCFGNIGRNGKFRYVYLPEKSAELYPANDLYPSDDLYPLGTNAIEFSRRRYKGSPTYEDYKVQKITQLQIRMEENDIGVVVGEGDNTYVIQDNFLVYGMSTEELTPIAENILNAIKVVEYRPCSVKAIGSPCLEVGDLIRINTKTINIDSYVLRRVLSGIQVLTDAYSATGEEKYTLVENGTSAEIRKLKAQSNVFTRTIEETRSEISKVETTLKDNYSTTTEMNNIISQTAEGTRQEISKVETTLKDNYSTTTEMNLAIEKSAEGITETISKTYTTQDAFDEAVKSLQDQIDGTLGNYSGSEVPTLDNYPANEWTTDLLKDAAIGSLYFVNSEGGDYAGFTYRFEKLSDGTYQWALLKDTEVTQALKELEDLKKNLSENYSTTVEMTSAIEKSATSVKTEVSKTYTTKNELTGLEEVVKSNTTAIESNAKEIELRAVESDITGNYLIAKINLDTTTAKITAKNIVLEGLVTANSNFKVLEDGSIEAVNATLNGSLISYSSDATCYMGDGEIRLYPEIVADPDSYEGDDYSVLSHDKFVLNGSAYINDLKVGTIGHKVMLSELTNGFYGLVDSSGSNSNWIRTTVNGLIPYQSGGSGSIGTSGWEFNNGHFKNIYTNGINFGNYGTGALWNTTFGQAGLYTLSSGAGLYLMTISSEVTGGWYSSILLADSSGVNLVPKTGGTFSGNLATSGTFTADGNIVSGGNIQCANRIKTQGTYDTTTTAAANMVIPSTYWTARSTASSKRYKHDIVNLQGKLNSEKLLDIPVRQYKYNLDYISDKDQRYNVDIPGFIAEELYEHYPIAVEIIDGQIEDWNHRMIIPPMLDLIQKLHRRITELEGRIKP